MGPGEDQNRPSGIVENSGPEEPRRRDDEVRRQRLDEQNACEHGHDAVGSPSEVRSSHCG